MSYYHRFLTALLPCLFLLSLKERESSSQRETCLSFIKMLFIFFLWKRFKYFQGTQFFLESSEVMSKRCSKMLLSQNTPLTNLHCIRSAFSLHSNRDSDQRERNRKKKNPKICMLPWQKFHTAATIWNIHDWLWYFSNDISQLLCFIINLYPTLVRSDILKGLNLELEEHCSMQQVALQWEQCTNVIFLLINLT